MAFHHRRYGSGKRPKSRGLTAAQQKAHDAAYEASDHTVEGRFSRGDVVAERSGAAWKIVTYGIRYHEDVSSAIYGVQSARGPAGFRETVELRAIIGQVLSTGIHEVGSRGGDPGQQQARPGGTPVKAWHDARPPSRASFPTLTVYEDGIVGVASPNYDDSPSVAWMQDAKLAARASKLIEKAPQPVNLPEVYVKERTVRLPVQPESPRYAAYAAARGVRIEPDGLVVPRIEHRRIKAELDAAGVEWVGSRWY